MFTNRLYVIFILIFSSFALADVPTPPAVIAQIPQFDQNHPNKLVSGATVTQDRNGKVTITTRPAANKSTFNGVGNSGGNIVGGRPINATVNNGYGNTGTINTQAASTYSKTAALRGAANKSIGVVGAAYALWETGSWTGTQLWNLYDCVVYESCRPNAQPLPVPPNAPSPPQSAWEAPKGAYDPNATVVTVFKDASGQPMIALYGVSLGSGGGKLQPDGSKIISGIDITPFTYSIPTDQWGYTSRYDFSTYTSAAELKKYENLAYDKVHPEAFERPFTEQDLYNALVWNLEHMPQEIATAIMNALHDGGFLGAPDSTVFDPASYTSPAYTASDTGVAQQDKFTINQDGSISHQVIARPDLQGNQQLAPEKQPSTNPTDPTNPPEPEKPKEPEEEVIPPIDDVVIPTVETPIAFAPDNTFQSDGVCPAPTVLNVMGASFDISYGPLCYFAEKIRPVLILMAAFSSLYFCLSVAFKG